MNPSAAVSPPGLGRQMRIYWEGREGRRPALPLDPVALETAALAFLPEKSRHYLGGAGREDTMRANLEAFRRRLIVPRMLVDRSGSAGTTRLFGLETPLPVMLAPIGLQELYHPEAERATARAAAALGLPLILSCQSSTDLESVAATAVGPRLFQLYWSRDEELTESFVRRAEAAGYAAIVITLDTVLLGWRSRDLAIGHNPFLEGRGMANYTSDPVFRARLGTDVETADPAEVVRTFMRCFQTLALTWADLARARTWTRLPIILKGIQHPDDARRALDAGMDGLIVSNHGGRQVDGAIASLDALPGVAWVVEKRIPVGFDGGVRGGADGFKALALGADFVCLGRPCVHGLTLGGAEGVREVLENFCGELDLTRALAGCATWADVGPGALAEAGAGFKAAGC